MGLVQQVAEAKAKNPDQSVASILKGMKVSPTTYYAEKRGAKGKRSRAKAPVTQAAERKPRARVFERFNNRMIFLEGTPEQIVAFLNERGN